MDPLVGLVGAVVIASWAVSLLRAAGRVLLDTVPDPRSGAAHPHADGARRRPGLRSARLAGRARVISPSSRPCVSASPQTPAVYKQRLAGLAGLSHVTVEVHAVGMRKCTGDEQTAARAGCARGSHCVAALACDARRLSARRSARRLSSMPRRSCPALWSICVMPARTISSAGRSTAIEAPHCLLTQPAADALAEVARDLAPRGLVIKVFDCYRPTRAVANFVRWARDLADQPTKAEFYPDVDKRTLFRDGYIASHSGHSRGSTIGPDVGASGRRRTRHGHAVRFLQSEIMDRRSEHHARAACQPHAAWRRPCSGAAFAATTRSGGTSRCAHEPFPDTFFDFPVQ